MVSCCAVSLWRSHDETALPPGWLAELEGRVVIGEIADDFAMVMTQGPAPARLSRLAALRERSHRPGRNLAQSSWRYTFTALLESLYDTAVKSNSLVSPLGQALPLYCLLPSL